MHDTLFVGLLQRSHDLRSQSANLAFRQRTRCELFCKGLSGYVLHHQKIDTFLPVEVIDGADVWLIQFGERQGFFVEPVARCFPGKPARRQYLQRHVPVQTHIVGAVYHAHSACAELFDHAIVRNRLASDSAGGLRRPQIWF